MPSVILFRPVYDAHARSAPTYPWALIYLSAVLVERGVDVTIIDEPANRRACDNLEHVLEEMRPVAVGITAMTGEQIRHGLAFAARVRK